MGIARQEEDLVDLDALQRVASDGDNDLDEKVVSRRWLKKVAAELAATRASFRSPIVDLCKGRAHG